jgi:hypothetical protein
VRFGRDFAKETRQNGPIRRVFDHLKHHIAPVELESGRAAARQKFSAPEKNYHAFIINDALSLDQCYREQRVKKTMVKKVRRNPDHFGS